MTKNNTFLMPFSISYLHITYRLNSKISFLNNYKNESTWLQYGLQTSPFFLSAFVSESVLTPAGGGVGDFLVEVTSSSLHFLLWLLMSSSLSIGGELLGWSTCGTNNGCAGSGLSARCRWANCNCNHGGHCWCSYCCSWCRLCKCWCCAYSWEYSHWLCAAGPPVK